MSGLSLQVGLLEIGGKVTSNERWLELRVRLRHQIDDVLLSRKGNALLSKRQEAAIEAYEKALEIMSELWNK